MTTEESVTIVTTPGGSVVPDGARVVTVDEDTEALRRDIINGLVICYQGSAETMRDLAAGLRAFGGMLEGLATVTATVAAI